LRFQLFPVLSSCFFETTAKEQQNNSKAKLSSKELKKLGTMVDVLFT
jgi:hypothetical protein